MKMNRIYGIIIFISTLILVGSIYFFWPQKHTDPQEKIAKMHYPYDQFFLQRSWPDTTFALEAYEKALQFTKRQIKQNQQLSSRNASNGIGSDWTLQGPGNIGGRFNVITIHPNSNDTIYAGSASGGVFKTVDGGQNWFPIFDDQSYLSVSAITLDPNNPNIVYVGTGDHNISGYPFIGDGVYKSMDGGVTWTYLGLKDTRIISRIVIDPTNSNTIYAATMGIPFVKNNDRGLYKSTDGGATWTQVLFVADQAGVIDLVIHPTNPQILYASSWDRIRNNSESIVTGVNAKIWKTTNGGNTWTALGGGLPTGIQGRIGLDMFRANPDTLFAIYVDVNSNLEGVYRTYNGGTTWTDVSGNLPTGFMGGFGWYFGQIRVNPNNHDNLWALGVGLYRSLDGGTTWNSVGGSAHVDKHDLQYGNNGVVFKATDGGLYSSPDNGGNWIDIENIPNNQFYRVAVNPFQPSDFYGGLQDNGSVGGNASGFNTWARYFGGDGFQMRFSPTNSLFWYCETQNGVLWVSTNGGMSFNWHNNGINGSDRVSWDMPFILSHSNASIQYCGTYRVYKNTGGANANWQVISPDITDGINTRYHVISTVNESPLDPNILYAGTTDGNVWITINGGNNWTDITDTLPDRYVTSVKGSTTNSSRLFVSHSGYKDNENTPHLHRSDDHGATWHNIAGDLPPLAINDIFIYPTNDSVIFVANDGGVYATLNAGTNWQRIGGNMPIVAVYDLEIEPVNSLLVAGSFGRSLWTFPIDSVFIPLDTVPTPQILVNGSASFCEGDSVLLSIANGPYDEYLWSNGDTTASILVTTAGTYSVIGIQNGCPSDSSASQVITVHPLPAKPTISTSGATQFCEGDNVTLNGPTGFSGYLWSNGATTPTITINQSSFITLTVTDINLCQSPPSDTFEVTAWPLPPAPMISGPSTICDGNSILLSGPSGFGGYFWSNNALVKDIVIFTPGIYTLAVIDSNNCMSPPSDSFIVSSGMSPVAMFGSDINGTQVNFSDSSLNVGASGLYQWNFGDSSAIDSSADPVHIFPGSGLYTVTLIVSNECGSDTLSAEISVIAASVDPDFSWAQSIQVYPNPAADIVFITIPQLSASYFEYQLIDFRGKTVYKNSKVNQVGEFTAQIPIRHLAQGIYLLSFSDGKNHYSTRILKKN